MGCFFSKPKSDGQKKESLEKERKKSSEPSDHDKQIDELNTKIEELRLTCTGLVQNASSSPKAHHSGQPRLRQAVSKLCQITNNLLSLTDSSLEIEDPFSSQKYPIERSMSDPGPFESTEFEECAYIPGQVGAAVTPLKDAGDKRENSDARLHPTEQQSAAQMPLLDPYSDNQVQMKF